MSRYLFDETSIERDVISLLSIVHASKQNHDLLATYLPSTGIFYSEWNLIQELLLQTAVKLRLIDGLFWDANKSIPYPLDSVGTLVMAGSEQALSFREACNKIIHAKDFVPQSQVERITDGYADRAYLPKIKLIGQKGSFSWEATVDVPQYCVCALKLLDEYDMSDVSCRTGELE